MPRNVEIKARLRDSARVATEVQRLAGGPPQVLDQYDVFYRGAAGRLKLRRFPDGSGELIHYDRPDRPGPKISQYDIYRSGAAAELARVLAAALAPAGEVRKRRCLFLIGRTRVHLDQVDGLGDFLELEIVLGPEEDPANGEREAHALLATLGVDRADLIAGAYVDLLAAPRGSAET